MELDFRVQRCGPCVKFHTPKCSFAFSTEPVKPSEPKTVTSFKEFLGWFNDYTQKPVPYRRVISNWGIIQPQDTACADFEAK